MLAFLRQHATTIVVSILVFFVGTMFSGALFFGGGFDLSSENNTVTTQQSSLAMIGNLPVDQDKYFEYLDLISQEANIKETGIISPDVIEYLQYSALNRAIQYSILLKEAKENNIKIDKTELNLALDDVFINLGVKDLKELKAMLKSNEYPFKVFIEKLKGDTLVQKLVRSLQASVAVTDKDVEDVFTSVKARQILLTPLLEESPEALLERMQIIQNRIEKGEGFISLVAEYSDDEASKDKGGELPWINVEERDRRFEKVLFSLGLNEISTPFISAEGAHILQVIDRKIRPYPVNFDQEKAKAELQTLRENKRIDELIQTHLNLNPLRISNPVLKAYDAKSKGRVVEAISAYQSQVSQNPNSAVPHYFLAKLYKSLNNKTKQEEELNKAEIKTELNPQYGFPAVYLELGQFYKNRKQYEKRNEAYQKAIDLVFETLGPLKQLEVAFTQLKEKSWARKVNKRISALEKELAAKKTEEALSNE